jgi:hypothetical protein
MWDACGLGEGGAPAMITVHFGPLGFGHETFRPRIVSAAAHAVLVSGFGSLVISAERPLQ